jgi:hypothetical protein
VSVYTVCVSACVLRWLGIGWVALVLAVRILGSGNAPYTVMHAVLAVHNWTLLRLPRTCATVLLLCVWACDAPCTLVPCSFEAAEADCNRALASPQFLRTV